MRAKHRPVSVGNVAKGIIDKVVTISLKDKPVLLGRVKSLLAMKRTKPVLYVIRNNFEHDQSLLLVDVESIIFLLIEIISFTTYLSVISDNWSHLQ